MEPSKYLIQKLVKKSLCSCVYHITATKCYVFQDLKLKSFSMQIHSADCKVSLKNERHFSNHISKSLQPGFIIARHS